MYSSSRPGGPQLRELGANVRLHARAHAAVAQDEFLVLASRSRQSPCADWKMRSFTVSAVAAVPRGDSRQVGFVDRRFGVDPAEADVVAPVVGRAWERPRRAQQDPRGIAPPRGRDSFAEHQRHDAGHVRAGPCSCRSSQSRGHQGRRSRWRRRRACRARRSPA